LTPRIRIYVLLAAVVLAVFVVAGCSQGNAPGPKKDNVAQKPAQASTRIPADEPVAQIASQIEPSVVQVNVKAIQTTPMGSQTQEGLGSGVIYRKDGYIVTNNHVVEGAQQVNVAFADGSTEKGQVVGADPRTDLAVVKVNRDNLPAAKFSKDDNLVPGQLAVAIGSPSGFESTVTSGVISGLNREISPQLTGGRQQVPSLVDLIQTDAAISPGNSGGALVDRNGEVIGINAAYLPPNTGAEGIGFSIPASTAISVADQLIETGQVSSPYLGIKPIDLTPQDAQKFHLDVQSGALVAEVGQGTPADRAGLRTGDIITAVDNTKIENSGDLFAVLRDYKPGDQIKITAFRKSQKQTLDATLAKLPQQQ
jgi:serine protease Do